MNKRELKPITPSKRGAQLYGPWPTTRAKAIELGTKTYFPGTPCKNGHVTTRKVSGGGCGKCKSEDRKEKYHNDEDRRKVSLERGREWRRKNPERHRASNREHARRAYHNDPEKFLERGRKWRAENPELAIASAKNWRENNPERVRAQNKKWHKENPGAKRAIDSRRKARKLGDNGPSYSAADVKDVLKKQRGKCAYCQIKLKKYHVDHIMPLALGGSNGKANIQITCPDCNVKKHASHPLDFAKKIGLLC